MATTTLVLVTGAEITLDGSAEEVAKALENAARRSAGTLAWLKENGTGETLAVNPTQVVTVRARDP